MTVSTHVVDCPECGAPLPPSVDGGAVKCLACGHVMQVAADDAAMAREHASRVEAEALYAVLGTPPSLSQRLAVLLVNKWVWIIGLAFMVSLFAWFGRMTSHLIERIYEHFTHVRLAHVASFRTLWLLHDGTAAAILVAVLVWSLFGERIDAKRDLQGALASKPPTTPGGPSLCRHCNAPLVIPVQALGVRCDHCGADNLVQIPPEWAANASKLAADLQLGTEAARKHTAEGKRRVRVAAMWRIPVVIAIVVIGGRSVLLAGSGSTFAQLRSPSQYMIAVHLPNGGMKTELWPLPACGIAPPKGAKVWAASSSWCVDPKDPKTSCDDVLVVALERREHFQLVADTPGPGHALLAIANLDDSVTSAAYIGYQFRPVGEETFAVTAAPKSVVLDVPIATTALYRLDLTMQNGTVVWPCIVPAK